MRGKGYNSCSTGFAGRTRMEKPAFYEVVIESRKQGQGADTVREVLAEVFHIRGWLLDKLTASYQQGKALCLKKYTYDVANTKVEHANKIIVLRLEGIFPPRVYISKIEDSTAG